MSFISKFFIFLFGLAVFAAVCAWIMGGESKKYSTRMTINASPTQVFRYLADGEKIKQWATDVESAGKYDGEGEEFATYSRVIRTEDGPTTWEDSVMRFQDGEILSIRSKNGGLSNIIVFRLEENEIGGTNIDYRLTKSASGWEQMLFPFQEDRSQTQMATEMTKLKNLIESEVQPAEEAPVVATPPKEENETESAPMPTVSSPSVVDRVLGTTYEKPRKDKKPVDGQRNFESLFGTGG